jgi:hypothetical protein
MEQSDNEVAIYTLLLLLPRIFALFSRAFAFQATLSAATVEGGTSHLLFPGLLCSASGTFNCLLT